MESSKETAEFIDNIRQIGIYCSNNNIFDRIIIVTLPAVINKQEILDPRQYVNICVSNWFRPLNIVVTDRCIGMTIAA